jgi:lipid-A-disaccharide synthase
VKALKNLDQGLIFWGIGGEKMERAGVRLLARSSEMAVVGLTEVFKRLHTITKASIKLKSILKNRRPDLLILIDYPEFNIHIAGTAKRFGVPVLYYISPQVWAWRRQRVRKISRRIDRMAVILPFEEAFYRRRGVKVDYVGHPLLDTCQFDVDTENNRARLGVERGQPIVGLLPGSRNDEVSNLLPVMLRSAKIIKERHPETEYLLPLADSIDANFVRSFFRNTEIGVKIVKGRFHDVLDVCDVVLVASGTATLEAAIMGTPMVIAYKISPVSYWVARMVVKVPFIGLVNLVAGREIVPELVQDDVTPERLAREALTILEDEEIMASMKYQLKEVREVLGRGGASEKTAQIALEMMTK